MQIIFVAVTSFIGRVAGRFLVDSSLKFVAYKSLIVTLFTVTLPATIKALLTWLMEGLLSLAGSVSGMNDFESVTAQFTGFAGYLAAQLMLPECLGIVLAACAVRLVLNFIPFIG